MKSIETAAFAKYNKHIKLSTIAKISGIKYQTLHLINKNPNSNPTIKVIEAIYKSTKITYGVGIKPWEYLNCSNYSEIQMHEISSEDIIKQIAIEKIKHEISTGEAVQEEQLLKPTTSGESVVDQIDKLIN